MAKQLTKKTTNRKQKKFVKKLVETGGNIAQATDLAGYAPGHGYHLMKQPKIQTELQLALEGAGLTDDTLATKIKDGQNATYVKKDGGKSYKDYHAIHKYCDMQIKIGGGYAPEKTEHIEKRMIFNVTPEAIKALQDCDVPKEEIEVLVGSVKDSDAIDAEIIEDKGKKKDE